VKQVAFEGLLKEMKLGKQESRSRRRLAVTYLLGTVEGQQGHNWLVPLVKNARNKDPAQS
jgi:hypothetical protein